METCQSCRYPSFPSTGDCEQYLTDATRWSMGFNIRYRKGKFYLLTSYVSMYPDFGFKGLLFSTEEIYSDEAIRNRTGVGLPEGPHIYKKDNWYYLRIGEGGTELGHRQVIARSHSVTGPNEGYAGNPILTNFNTTEYFQTVGHADLFQDGNGNWWGVVLATRSGPAWRVYPMGRETVLFPATWKRDSFAVSPPERPYSLRLLPSSLNITGLSAAGERIEKTPITLIMRRQSHTYFTYSVEVSFVLAEEGEGGRRGSSNTECQSPELPSRPYHFQRIFESGCRFRLRMTPTIICLLRCQDAKILTLFTLWRLFLLAEELEDLPAFFWESMPQVVGDQAHAIVYQ
ncbi:uncharacterized protein ANIA_01043 [Aspergillus nidulans FGSC A4]|uniref:Beta-xylosidase C-terminal Concanavalin A-like domain-containing protein n=1 Tax=Emericella nidulans (strain FGSC A4 / ATCC 38163 / CBS 112.46 / NRRL 194 / M139) TaxID=227321 RepID=C8VTW7_EMENI|nr:hypothetical protein [Aspergillus nidulans FGSC A4]CBF88272.1 TPA: conserved hypothetical protein [Aspergillus nidulans FGSC A4]